MKNGYGVCPVCNGAGSDGVACRNCGGQSMYGRPTGKVPLRPDGTPCTHKYKGEVKGRCYTVYTCVHCNHRYDIDSGG